MRPNDFDIEKVCEALDGTLDSLRDALPEGMEESELTKDDWNVLNDRIFQCDSCGWWYDVSQRCLTDGNGDMCEDCHENQQEE